MKYRSLSRTRSGPFRGVIGTLVMSILLLFGTVVLVEGEFQGGSERMFSDTPGNSILRMYHGKTANGTRSGVSPVPFCAPPEPGNASEAGKRKRAQLREKRKQQIKRLGRKYVPDGNLTINSPGAIKGARMMEDPWTLETIHYKVKTDISKKAVGEIALIMEMFYNAFVGSPLFSIDETSYQKLPVIVTKNRSEFTKVVASSGINVGSSVRGLFLKSSTDRKMVAYYFHDNDMDMNLGNVLLHEGTHQFLDLTMKSDVPIWLEEGLASYFENSRFDGWKLKTGQVNVDRLRTIRRQIRFDPKGTRGFLKDLPDLMRMSGRHFSGRNYAQAWSLVHFLIHWQDGKLLKKVRDYLDYYKQKDVKKDPVQVFREIFGFHPDEMRKAWKKYVLEL